VTARQRLAADPMLRSYAAPWIGAGLGPTVRNLRRLEAEERNARTPHDRTRAHRVCPDYSCCGLRPDMVPAAEPQLTRSQRRRGGA
jgi:hypothetical protein